MGVLKRVEKEISSHYPFGIDDFFQQVIGSMILISPFIVTEEVWRLGRNMTPSQALASAGITLLLGHGVLYVAYKGRDFAEERKVLFFPWRYISLMSVSFGTVLLIIQITGAASTFSAGPVQTLKVVSFISIFSVIGAGISDSAIQG